MRGRLINPFLCELAQLDTVATAADPDGAGSLTAGYDADFREPVVIADGTSGGVVNRKEKDHILVPCQVEDRVFDDLRMFASGNLPDYRMILVFHFRDLEEMGLVDDDTGDAMIRNGDRLVAIRRYRDQALIQSIRTPPGLYVTEPQPRSFGLSGGERNLLVVTFEDREQGLARSL